MNRLTLHIPPDAGPFDPVRIHIDGRALVERVAEAEAPHVAAVNAARQTAGPPQSAWRPMQAARYGHPTVAMLRGGLAAALLGRGASDPGVELEAGEVVLLVCDCGEAGCGAVVTRVDLLDGVVVWSGFRQPQRGWALDVGPLRFDRAAYAAALAPFAERPTA
ncbi:MAG: hypothetical protein R3F65_32580 [bacterium]